MLNNNTAKTTEVIPEKEELLMIQQMEEEFTEIEFRTQFSPVYNKVKFYRGANVEDILRQLFYAHFAYKQELWLSIEGQIGYRIMVEVYDKATDNCVYIQNRNL